MHRRKRQYASGPRVGPSGPRVRLRQRPTIYEWALTFLLSLASPSRSIAGYFYGYNKNNDCNDYDCPVPLSLCEDSVVQITNIDWGCNGQGAYYWGSSNHRSSKVCSINDKVTFDVTVVVTDTINEVNDIYVTLAVQDSSNSLILASKSACSLCDLIGSSCTQAGTYQFSITSKLEDSSGSSSGSYDDFCPTLIASFSTEQDSGYNLGAANMECQPWENQFASWTTQEQNRQQTPEEWISDYGMFIGVAVCLVAFAGFLWHEANRIPTLSSCAVVDPCTMELDQYYYYNNRQHSHHGTSQYLGATTPQRNAIPASIPTTPGNQSGLSIPLHHHNPSPTSPLPPPLTLKTLATGGVSSPHLLQPPTLPSVPSAASMPLETNQPAAEPSLAYQQSPDTSNNPPDSGTPPSV